MLNCDVQVPFPDHVSHPIDDVNISQILAITNIGGRLIHYVQLEGGKKTLMPSTLTNVLVPQLVIEFYQKKVFFVNIYNQRMRPIKQNMRRHARKSTNSRIYSQSSSSKSIQKPPPPPPPQSQAPQIQLPPQPQAPQLQLPPQPQAPQLQLPPQPQPTRVSSPASKSINYTNSNRSLAKYLAQLKEKAQSIKPKP